MGQLPINPEIDDALHALYSAMDLCCRKAREEPDQHDTLWFKLMETVAQYVEESFDLKNQGRNCERIISVMQNLFRIVVGTLVDSQEEASVRTLALTLTLTLLLTQIGGRRGCL